MADADTRTETAPTAPPLPDEAAILSGLIELSATMAQAFQAEALAALQAGDLDRACKAETRVSRLFLGIRRAIALKARLRQQQDEARRAADQDRDERLARAADRRRRVAEGVTGAIAAATAGAMPDDTETREQLTADLWDRLAGDHRDRPDTADRALPIEDLIRSMCRALGIPPDRAAIAAALAGTAEVPARIRAETAGHTPAEGWFRPVEPSVAGPRRGRRDRTAAERPRRLGSHGEPNISPQHLCWVRLPRTQPTNAPACEVFSNRPSLSVIARRRSRRSNPGAGSRWPLDCFAALAMTMSGAGKTRHTREAPQTARALSLGRHGPERGRRPGAVADRLGHRGDHGLRA
jgi:hypothetical protein